MRKALITDGLVQQIIDKDPFPPFHPDLTWVECGASVGPGWLYDGSVFTAPTGPTLVEVKKQKRDDINCICHQIILTRWPLDIQISIIDGYYDDGGQCYVDRSLIIGQSNAARNEMYQLDSIDAVLAFTPTFSDIGVYEQEEPV